MSASSATLPSFSQRIDRYSKLALAELRDGASVEHIWEKLLRYEGEKLFGIRSDQHKTIRQDLRNGTTAAAVLSKLETDPSFIITPQSDTCAALSVLYQLWPNMFADLPPLGKIRKSLMPVNLAKFYFDNVVHKHFDVVYKASHVATTSSCFTMMPYISSAKKDAILDDIRQNHQKRLKGSAGFKTYESWVGSKAHEITELQILESIANTLPSDEMKVKMAPFCDVEYKHIEKVDRCEDERLVYLCKLDPDGFFPFLEANQAKFELAHVIKVMRNLSGPQKSRLANLIAGRLLLESRRMTDEDREALLLELASIGKLLDQKQKNDLLHKLLDDKDSAMVNPVAQSNLRLVAFNGLMEVDALAKKRVVIGGRSAKATDLFTNDILAKYECRTFLNAIWRNATPEDKKKWLTPPLRTDAFWVKRMSMIVSEMDQKKLEGIVVPFLESKTLEAKMTRQTGLYVCELLGEIANHMPILRTRIIGTLLQQGAYKALEKIPLDQDYQYVLGSLEFKSAERDRDIKNLVLRIAPFVKDHGNQDKIITYILRFRYSHNRDYVILAAEYCKIPWVAQKLLYEVVPLFLRALHLNILVSDSILGLRYLALVMDPSQQKHLLRELLIIAEQQNNRHTDYQSNLLNNPEFLDLLDDFNSDRYAACSQVVGDVTDLLPVVADITASYVCEPTRLNLR